MNVLFITQVVDRADDNLGAVHGWISALAGEVDSVHVLALRTGQLELPRNVQLHSMGKDQGRGKLGQWRVLNSVAAGLCLRRQVDVFFPHMVPLYALLVAPYRAAFRVPTVMWYAHNSADLRLKSALPFVDRIASVSEDSFPVKTDRLRVVGHGVDTALFKPSGTDAGSRDDLVSFLSLGRISPRKELDTLVSAAEILVNRWECRAVEFVVAGAPLATSDHEYLGQLKARVRDRGLEGYFRFTGGIPHSETARVLRRSDFFVNMHVEGGLGKAVLEAMSCGLPAIVSTPTYYERFPEYAERFLFGPRDPEALAARMRSALRMTPPQRQAVGQELRDWVVEEHDVRRQMSRIVRVFHEARGGLPSSSR